MIILKLLKQKNISIYRLSKESGIPYTTLNDIVSGKARLEKCSAETIYKLSKALDISMEELLEPCLTERCDFELFKSNVCHSVKVLGDVEFIIDTLEKDKIREFYDRQWYRESFYLLAMLDYISRVNNVPKCIEYNDIRNQKLQEPLYPKSIIALASVSDKEAIKEQARREAIPEFMQFNIVESEVRNVI